MSTEFIERSLAGVLTEILKYGLKTLAQNYMPSLVEQFAKYYLRHITERYQSINVFGMKESIPLEELYMDTYLSPMICEKTAVRSFESMLELRVATATEPALGIVCLRKRVCFLGGPGSGKSTVLRRIMKAAIGDEFAFSSLPILIELSKYKDGKQSISGLILRELEFCEIPFLDTFYQAAFQSGKVMLLLDGIDEIPPDVLPTALDELEYIFEKYPENRYVLTCRPGSYKYWFEEFHEYEIAATKYEQIQSFVLSWFKHSNNLSKGAQCLEEIQANCSIREIATNPLFLTLICILYENNRVFSPSKVDIYEEATQTILSHWDSKRNISRKSIYKDITLGRRQQFYEQIAFCGFENDVFYWQKEEIERSVAEFLDKIPLTASHNSPQDFLSELVSHHAIIYQAAKNIYAFSHRGMQEYFCAKHAKTNNSESMRRIMLDRLVDDSWEDVISLYSALLPDATVFLTELISEVVSTVAALDIETKKKKLESLLLRNSPYTPAITRFQQFSRAIEELSVSALMLDREYASGSRIGTNQKYLSNLIQWAKKSAVDVEFDRLNIFKVDDAIDLYLREITTRTASFNKDTVYIDMAENIDTIARNAAEMAAREMKRTRFTNLPGRVSTMDLIDMRWRDVFQGQFLTFDSMLQFSASLDVGYNMLRKGYMCLNAGSLIAKSERDFLVSKLSDAIVL